jgi:hypothetical protein
MLVRFNDLNANDSGKSGSIHIGRDIIVPVYNWSGAFYGDEEGFFTKLYATPDQNFTNYL